MPTPDDCGKCAEREKKQAEAKAKRQERNKQMKDPGAQLVALIKRVEAVQKQIRQQYSKATPEIRGQIEGVLDGFVSIGDLRGAYS